MPLNVIGSNPSARSTLGDVGERGVPHLGSRALHGFAGDC